MERSKTTPDAYLASLPDEVRDDMTTLDAEISQVMAGDSRVLWEGRFWGGSDQRIIGYRDITYRGKSGKSVEWFVIGLAAQKNYITVFAIAESDGRPLAEVYRDRLGKVKVGRSSISFKRLADIDLAALRELLTRVRELAPSS